MAAIIYIFNLMSGTPFSLNAVENIWYAFFSVFVLDSCCQGQVLVNW